MECSETLLMDASRQGENEAERVRELVAAIYRADSRRVLATLVRLLGDFDRAEEALHDAFAAAIEQWPENGVPANPRAWLVSAGRFKAIDSMRRQARFDTITVELAQRVGGVTVDTAAWAAQASKTIDCG
jgi:RNA polymerase sigma-70 factor (ECF subfamily)